MLISPIQNKIYTSLSFQRRPREDEKEDMQRAIENGFDVAGVKKRIAITHGSVFPAVGRDTFIGSPYGEGAKEWISFLKLYGFNGNQLGPNGALYGNNPSPYNSSALNENPLFVDLKALTSDRYGRILSKKTYERITLPIEKNDKNYAFADFAEAKLVYYLALNEAYRNFKKNLAKGQPNAIMLNNQFTEFKETPISDKNTKGSQTEEEGIYRVLAAIYKTEDFTKWDRLDSNLMAEIRKENPAAVERYKELKRKYKDAINEYQFEQFIVTKQIQDNKEFRNKLKFKYYSDLLIGCSKMDYWRYKEAFLDGYSVGAYEYGDKPHQTWNIPVLDPRKLFIGYDELNIGGEFLKEKLEHALEYCENIRIDHALGLIDPFIYKMDTVKYDENGNQIKNEIHGDFLSRIHDENGNKIDDYYNYPRILEKLVLPVLKEHDLDKDDPVWESLCCEPELYKKIYYQENNLPKLVQTEFNKAEGENNRNWFLIGSHDSIPVMNMLSSEDGWRRNNYAWDADYLSKYLHKDPTREQEKEIFYKKIANTIDGIPKVGKELEKADRELVKAKFAELFTKEKIMVSFADILGITDKNIVYNIGGSNNEANWRERISSDFIDKYYENLSSNNPTALNIPEVLKIAVQAKLDMEITQSPNPDQTRKELNEKYKPLIDKLEHYANVLKEKEQI